MKLNFFILLFIVAFVSSCNTLFSKIYGISNDIQICSNQEIVQIAEKYKISKLDIYKLDTTYYDFIFSLKDPIIIKNHCQPLQAVYFDKNGKIEAFFINCYANGFPNLKWNENHDFDVFPPTQQQGLIIDTLVNYNKIKSYIKPIFESQINDDDFDYFVIVFWSKAGGRQSKRLIKQIHENVKLAKDNVKLMFVNNDSYSVFY
jgi:hypothetical protein